MPETIGLIGIGLVGEALAKNLLAHGFGVVGYDNNPARNQILGSMGGTPVDNPRQVAEKTRRVMLSLLTTDTVVEVVEGRTAC